MPKTYMGRKAYMTSVGRGPYRPSASTQTTRTVFSNKGTQTRSKRPRSKIRVETLDAYANRRSIRPMLQPFVETKRDQSGILNGALQTTDAFTVFPCPSYLYRDRGLGERQMVGSSVYGRYLGFKLRLMFPRHDDAIDIPTGLQVYFITVDAPMAATSTTTPSRQAVTKLQLEAHIEQQLKEFFNGLDDRMEFRPKLQGFTIDKMVEVKPDRNAQIGRPQSNIGGGAAVGSGGPPDVFINHSWPIKQKLHYQLADNLGSDTHYLNRPEGAGYKCCVVYNPDFAGQNSMTDQKISYQRNDQLWFGDQ